MKKLITALTMTIALLFSLTTVHADEGWTERGCYRYKLIDIKGSDQQMLVVDTAELLTLDKDASISVPNGRGTTKLRAFSEIGDVQKLCTPKAVSLYGKLKLPGTEISAVVIGLRQFSVYKFPWPTEWVKNPDRPKARVILPDILKIIDDVLCSK